MACRQMERKQKLCFSPLSNGREARKIANSLKKARPSHFMCPGILQSTFHITTDTLVSVLNEWRCGRALAGITAIQEKGLLIVPSKDRLDCVSRIGSGSFLRNIILTLYLHAISMQRQDLDDHWIKWTFGSEPTGNSHVQKKSFRGFGFKGRVYPTQRDFLSLGHDTTSPELCVLGQVPFRENTRWQHLLHWLVGGSAGFSVWNADDPFILCLAFCSVTYTHYGCVCVWMDGAWPHDFWHKHSQWSGHEMISQVRLWVWVLPSCFLQEWHRFCFRFAYLGQRSMSILVSLCFTCLLRISWHWDHTKFLYFGCLKDGSMVKGACCFPRGLVFGSHHRQLTHL